MATSSSAHDIFAVHLLYHKSCYNKFVYIILQQKRTRQQLEETGKENKKEEVIGRFCKLTKHKLLNYKKAFFLIDISDLSEEDGLEPVAKSAKSM